MPRTEQTITMNLDNPHSVTAAQDIILGNAGSKNHDMHVEIDNGRGEKATVIIQSEMLYIVGIKNGNGTILPEGDISYTKLIKAVHPEYWRKVTMWMQYLYCQR